MAAEIPFNSGYYLLNGGLGGKPAQFFVGGVPARGERQLFWKAVVGVGAGNDLYN